MPQPKMLAILSARCFRESDGNLYALVGLKPDNEPKSSLPGKAYWVKIGPASMVPTVDTIPDGLRWSYAALVAGKAEPEPFENAEEE